MLDRYAWSWRIYEKGTYWQRDDALTFLTVLDSFSVILGDLQPENSILLNQDINAYCALESSRCWDDLKKFERYKWR